MGNGRSEKPYRENSEEQTRERILSMSSQSHEATHGFRWPGKANSSRASGAARILIREVTLRAKDLLIVLMVIFPVSSVAQMTPVFGPQQFTRMSGTPQTFTAPFAHCGVARCQIVVDIGNADSSLQFRVLSLTQAD
jgi:hypothetical protein